jgi:DNA-binding XRE family transcriptional regulator
VLYLGEALKILPLELLPKLDPAKRLGENIAKLRAKRATGRRRLTLLPIESPGYRNLRHDSSAMKRDTPLNVIGPEIRRIRKQRGWSQSKLAHHLQSVGWNISRSSLAKIECRIMWVGDFELLYFVRALGVGIESFFHRQARSSRCMRS